MFPFCIILFRTVDFHDKFQEKKHETQEFKNQRRHIICVQKQNKLKILN
ncbi:MAG: hypothetical protein JWR23_2623 [Mucilaginibacter sp.]|jgi:hypothetical protein|nr:hypothetical protein [Mucilaginibacter sp.]